MALEFRYVYANPSPVPASDWTPVRHGASVGVPEALMSVQFRDSDYPIDEDDPRNAQTLFINRTLEVITDSNGMYVQPDVFTTLQILADAEALTATKEG